MGKITEETWATMKAHWRLTALLIFGALALLLKDSLGSFTFSSSLLYYAIFAIVILVGASMWNEWRYKTRQYVDLTGHGSVKAPGFYPVGDYGVIPVGSVDAEGFSYEGGQGTRIVPRSSIQIWPTFIVSWSRPTVREKRHLPSEVQAFLEGRRSCGPPYYFTGVNLMPLHMSDVYRTVVKQLTGNPGGSSLSPEELKTRLNNLETTIESEIKGFQKKYNKETTRHDEKFTTMQGVITAQQELLADKYQIIEDAADALGTVGRATKKEPFLKRYAGKEKKSQVE